jgi:hypothetical protein
MIVSQDQLRTSFVSCAFGMATSPWEYVINDTTAKLQGAQPRKCAIRLFWDTTCYQTHLFKLLSINSSWEYVILMTNHKERWPPMTPSSLYVTKPWERLTTYPSTTLNSLNKAHLSLSQFWAAAFKEDEWAAIQIRGTSLRNMEDVGNIKGATHGNQLLGSNQDTNQDSWWDNGLPCRVRQDAVYAVEIKGLNTVKLIIVELNCLILMALFVISISAAIDRPLMSHGILICCVAQ